MRQQLVVDFLEDEELKSMWDGYAILIGHNRDQRTDYSRWYFGAGSQISGLLILLVGVAYAAKFAYLHSLERQR